MRSGLYRFLSRVARTAGLWVVAVFAWFLSTGYFLFRPSRVRESLRFYHAVFPHMGLLARLRLTWRQFHVFAAGFADRLRLAHGSPPEVEARGFGELSRLVRQGRGAIVVMSHFGNWEVAARMLRRQGVPLLLFVGQVRGQDIEAGQKQDVAGDGVRVVVADDTGGNPFDLLEAVRFLKEGGFVSLAGDRVQSPRQRTVEGTFFGHAVRVPAAPHLLARLSGRPLFHLFPVRRAAGRFSVTVEGPHFPAPAAGGREAFLSASVSAYLASLETRVREHPEQWFHFERFLL